MTIEAALTALIGGLPGLRLAGEVEWDLENLPALAPHHVPIVWDPPVQ
jgi:hypothetical protein